MLLRKFLYTSKHSIFTHFRLFSELIKKKNIYSFKKLKYSVLNAPNKEDIKKDEEEMILREIQKRPKYESAIACLVSGENKRGLKNLLYLKEDLEEENKRNNSDFLFLLKKIVSAYKFEKENIKIIEILKEYYSVTVNLYESDLNSLFNEIEYVAINFIHIDPKESIMFLKEVIEKQIFPPFFNHIFLYYLGTAFLLVGKDYDAAIKCLRESLESVDDEYLKSCILNNYCCAQLWFKSQENVKKLEDIDKISTVDFAKESSKDMLNIIKQFKETIILNEDLKITYLDDIKFDIDLMTAVSDEDRHRLILKFVLSKSFDLYENTSVIKELTKIKMTLTKNRISGLIFSHLGEIYFMMNEFKKALVYLNLSNLFFNEFDKFDPLYYKNFALLAFCDYQISHNFDKSKKMFEKIINIIKQYQGIYEKIFIYRLYSDFLIKNKNTQIFGYEYAKKSEDLEANIQYFQGRKSYLVLPSVNSEEKNTI